MINEIKVDDKGPIDSKIVIIGESPGANEVQQGRPFVGKSGILLERWMKGANIDPKGCFYTNVYPYYPEGGNVYNAPYSRVVGCIQDVQQKISTMRPNVIVAVGNLALSAFTDEPKPTPVGKRWEFRGTGILKRRGSLYTWHNIKVYPTIHPAAILRGGGGQRGEAEGGIKSSINWEKRCRQDWLRIAKELEFAELDLPKRVHVIEPTDEEVSNFINGLSKRDNPILALDIETDPSEGKILCVGFSYDPSFSITIPYGQLDWWDKQIKYLCEFSCDKGGQYLIYDYYWLAVHSMHIKRWVYDSCFMHHFIDPIEEHTLNFMASYYLRTQYWKDDGKFQSKEKQTTRSWNDLLTYCGKDVCHTLELINRFIGILGNDRLELYYRNYTDLYYPIADLMLHGVAVDVERMKERYIELKKDACILRDKLSTFNEAQPLFKLTTKRDNLIYEALVAGNDIHNIKKSKNKVYSQKEVERSLDVINSKTVSNQELMKLLYEKMQAPMQYKIRKTGKNKGQKTPTIDELALRRTILYTGSRRPEVREVCEIALKQSRTAKLSEFYQTGRVDADGRMRCSYKPLTETTRFMSSANPMGGGANAQNLDRESRDIYVPDEGCILVQCDMSQAEDRIVKVLAYNVTGDEDLLKRARAMPDENDEHRRTASFLFHKPESEVTSEERKVAKARRHGINYGLQAKRLVDEAIKSGGSLTLDEAERDIRIINDADPWLEAWQMNVREQIMRTRTLRNSWGAIWKVLYDALDPHLYSRALAWRPQSECGMLLNLYGFAPLWWHLKKHNITDVKINLQVHDALVFSTPPDKAYEIADLLNRMLTRPRIYDGVALSIPCEFNMGVNWKFEQDAFEFKRLPGKEEFTAAAHDVWDAIKY